MLQCAHRGCLRFRSGKSETDLVSLCRSAPALTGVPQRSPPGIAVQGHSAVHVVQIPERPGDSDCETAVSIQTEEPHSAQSTLMTYISTEIGFQKPRDDRDGCCPPWTHAFHGEGHQSQPRCPVKRFHRQSLWQMDLQLLRIHLPVQKDQVSPVLEPSRRLR